MKRLLMLPLALAAVLAGGATRVVQDQCGPFVDVSPTLCPFVLELYYLGITAGTSATTFSPDNPMTRGQAAVFVSKGANQAIARSSRRASLGQWWTTQSDSFAGQTAVGQEPNGVVADGQDIWVANNSSDTVSRVRASDGRLSETWTAADGAVAILAAMGRVFVLSGNNPGTLYMIDPAQTPGNVTVVATDLGNFCTSLTFDGSRIWVAASGGGLGPGSISIVTPSGPPPWSVTTVTDGIGAAWGILFDGSNVWATTGSSSIVKLDGNGAVLQTVPLGNTGATLFPVFDGTNIFVPTVTPNVVQVVRVSDGQIVATLSGNGVDTGVKAGAFDGERILFTAIDHVSLWRAADLRPLGSYAVSSNFACSDGINFWITYGGASGRLTRF